MPYSVSSGPLGLLGRHTWNGAFTLNDLEVALPRIHLDTISGLYSLPELTDLRDPRIAANGEVLYPSFTLGKTVTYEGQLIAVEGNSLHAYRWAMLAAFADQSNEGTMVITPNPAWGSGGWSFQARVLALDIDEEIIADSMTEAPSPYKVHFILSLRMRNNVFTQV